MEVDGDTSATTVKSTSAKTCGTVTIVTPTNLVSSIALPTAQPQIIQTVPSASISVGSTPKLQVLKLVTPDQHGKSSDTVRLVTSGTLQGTKIQISATPSINQQKTVTTQRLILPATSVRNSPQIVTIPVQQNTSRLHSALSSSPALSAQQNSLATQQVLAFISPQKSANQPITAKVVAHAVAPQPSTSAKGIMEMANSHSLMEPAVVKKEPALEESKQRKPCNCTKSHCLKLYCDCFANGEFCNNCNCVSCANNLENEEQRQKAIKQCLMRNPQAFHPKIGKGESAEVRRHQKGCNCKRSGCLKNYCECFEAKIACGSMCKCVGCKNCEDSAINKSLMNLADAAMVRTMQQNAASDRLAEPLHNLTTIADSNKTREAMKAHLKTPVIQSVLDCLLSQCREAEIAKCKSDTTEKVIMEEFGRCVTKIIQSATVSKT